MLDLDTRQAILRLATEGHGARTIARVLGISRNAVRSVIRGGTSEVPKLVRVTTLDGHLDTIRELYLSTRGNLVRVHEELEALGVDVGYPTLTAFCRRHGIGTTPKKPAGRYHFEPGEEMQHDTSPHTVEIAGKREKLHCASLVLCHSRMLFARCYARFNRFWCKVFLTDALVHFGGAAHRCVVDNTSVVIAHGSGAGATIAPEMEALAERFGFEFLAHEVGDANRSARVERPFHYIENNFYAGRRFESLADLNEQLAAWCDRSNRAYKRHLRATPSELFQVERAVLRALPIHVPEIYEQVVRIVDVEGFVHLHTNRYSVPPTYLHRTVRVRASKDRVRIYDGHELVCEHARLGDGLYKRSTLPGHSKDCHLRRKRELREEKLLRTASDVLGRLVDVIKLREGGRAARGIRRLHRLYLEYPTHALVGAAEVALHHGLYDLARIENLLLSRLAGSFFRLDSQDDGGAPPIASEEDNDGRRSGAAPEEPEAEEDA
jgi:transposase